MMATATAGSTLGSPPCERPHGPEALLLTGVTKAFPARSGAAAVTAVDSVDLAIRRSDLVAITGRSGSGKTTLLNAAAGLTRPTSGKVVADGIDLWTLSDSARSRLRNAKVGFVFQFPSLIPNLSVLENVLLPVTLGRRSTEPRDSERALQLLETVGIADKTRSRPTQLSAGQQQRAVIARALILSASILVADEPTSSLDEQTEAEIMALFERLNAVDGVTILMVTHDSALAGRCPRHLHMEAGRLTETPG
jgi:ABC-type lipoprotein export system ATPase subunit